MDRELEALIDKAGRRRVFDYMRANGWTQSESPPKYVWQTACHEIINGWEPERHYSGGHGLADDLIGVFGRWF